MKKLAPEGASWRDVARWFWEFLGPAIKTLLGPLVGSGGVYVIAGNEFVWSSHFVPGWVLVVAAGVAGLCVVGVGLHVYRRWLRKRGGFLVIVYAGPRALCWQLGKGSELTGVMP